MNRHANHANNHRNILNIAREGSGKDAQLHCRKTKLTLADDWRLLGIPSIEVESSVGAYVTAHRGVIVRHNSCVTSRCVMATAHHVTDANFKPIRPTNQKVSFGRLSLDALLKLLHLDAWLY
jgi:hypothetical protein